MSTPNKLGTKLTSEQQAALVARTGVAPPPPVIPTTWLAPHEQRFAVLAVFGLIEVMKVWDILLPYLPFIDLEPTWSTAYRVKGPGSVLGWFVLETAAFILVTLLRIPKLSPTGQANLVKLILAMAVWNLACWVVAEPGVFLHSIYAIGPASLSAEWYWNWYYRITPSSESQYISGTHKIRLLPYSTATLNPASLHYCIPPGDNHPLYIPIVFNNSLPEQVSYFVRSLETGQSDVKTIKASHLKRHASSHHLAIEDEDAEDLPPPSLALMSRSSQNAVVKANSVKPAESLEYGPQEIAPTEHVLFLQVEKPAVVSLKTVVDSRGDRFHISPHREAVIIECPTGGHFVDEKSGQLVPVSAKKQPAELRCQGDSEVVQFQARGVGALRVGWQKEKEGRDTAVVDEGVIEGIEEDAAPVDELALVRQDKLSRTHVVPLRVSHNTPGLYDVSLTSVEDSMKNRYHPSESSARKTFNVIPRPSASFAADNRIPRELLVGRTTTLQVSFDGLSNEQTELVYSFRPDGGEEKVTTKKIGKKTETIVADQPGVYTLLEIKGPCGGLVKEPSTFGVQLVPKPTLDMQVTTLHECAMDVGVTASFDFNGSPPFAIEYTAQRNGEPKRTYSERFQGHAGSIVLTPPDAGEYTYNVISLSDSKYSKVPLDTKPIKQVVHPLATADLVGRRRTKLHACSGNEVEIEFDVKGVAPLTLNYHVIHSGRVSNETWTGSSGRQKVKVPVPRELSDEQGGSGPFAITLLSVTDANGCTKRLPAPTFEVEVDRQRPTVRFAKGDKVTVTEGEIVKVPLSLSGAGPWTVTYSRDSTQMTSTLRDRNSELSFDKKGLYKLVKVKDAHCPGNVLDEATYEIDFKPRPQVQLLASTGSIAKGSSVSRETEFCAGQEDSVSFTFTGKFALLHSSSQAPYELHYWYIFNGGKPQAQTLKSAQSTGILHLATEPGKHQYSFDKLKDANYKDNKVNIAINHNVHGRPSATFAKANSKALCLDTHLASDARVKLTGKAPFDLELSVRRPASNRVESFPIRVKSNEWTLDLPYEVKDVGRHEVTISSVQDATGCAWDLSEKDVLSTVVEVVESARIVPVDHETDLCVGDTLDFLLQGKAPWTIEYEWLNKKHRVSSSASKFSRFAEAPGTFSVKSVALKENECKRTVSGMDRIVHAIPRAKVQTGEQMLREGDEPAAFGVRFTGTPPYSFTYTRSETTVGSKSRVVETQTITDIMEEEYRITSSLPGDYEVTSVSDKYCRYPPVSRGRD